MATPTYDLLDSTTLGTAAASVTFSGISGSYRDLILVTNTEANAGYDQYLQFNSDTAANYSLVRMFGTGSSTGSSTIATTHLPVGDTYAYKGNMQVQIMDYSDTSKQTTVLSRSSNASNTVIATAGRWANTAAVTTVTLQISSSTYAAGSTFALYGIAS